MSLSLLGWPRTSSPSQFLSAVESSRMGPLLPLQTVCPALCHLGISCGNVYTECNGLSHPSRSNQHDGGRHGQKAHPTWLRRWSVSHSCTLRQTFRPSRIRDTGPPLTRDISTAHNPQSTCTSTGAGRARSASMGKCLCRLAANPNRKLSTPSVSTLPNLRVYWPEATCN